MFKSKQKYSSSPMVLIIKMKTICTMFITGNTLNKDSSFSSKYFCLICLKGFVVCDLIRRSESSCLQFV